MLHRIVQAYYRLDAASPDGSLLVGGPGLSVDLWWLEGSSVTTVQAGGRPKVRRGAVVGGALTRMLRVEKGRDAAGFGVSLAPAAAAALFGVDASALADDFVDMDDALKASAPDLRERVQEAKTHSEKARVVERELSALLTKRGDVDDRASRIVARITESLRGATVESLAAETGFTRRSMVNLVQRSLGITPKELIRIMRFRRALRLMEGSSRPDWLTIAHECGYADQSHLIRHCKRFTGLAPGDFLERRLFPPLAHQVPRSGPVS